VAQRGLKQRRADPFAPVVERDGHVVDPAAPAGQSLHQRERDKADHALRRGGGFSDIDHNGVPFIETLDRGLPVRLGEIAIGFDQMQQLNHRLDIAVIRLANKKPFAAGRRGR